MSLGQEGKRRAQNPVVYPNGFLAEMTFVKFLTFFNLKFHYFQTVPVKLAMSINGEGANKCTSQSR